MSIAIPLVWRITEFDEVRGCGFVQITGETGGRIIIQMSNHGQATLVRRGEELYIKLFGKSPTTRTLKVDDAVCLEVANGEDGKYASTWVFTNEVTLALEYGSGENSQQINYEEEGDDDPSSDWYQYNALPPRKPRQSVRYSWKIILGFIEGDTPTIPQVKKKYRKLAMTHHPDLGGNHEIMATITNAYNEALVALSKR